MSCFVGIKGGSYLLLQLPVVSNDIKMFSKCRRLESLDQTRSRDLLHRPWTFNLWILIPDSSSHGSTKFTASL